MTQQAGVKERVADPASALRAAICGDDPQLLIALMNEARLAERRSDFAAAIEAIVLKGNLGDAEWQNLEFFVIEADLASSELREQLEQLSSTPTLTTDARISVYSMLRRSGSTRLLSIVRSDLGLKVENPEVWMDLLIASTPETKGALEATRTALLREIADRKLGAIYLLDRMRMIVKLGIGATDDWISRLSDVLRPQERDAVRTMIDRAFDDEFRPSEPQPSLEAVRSFFQDRKAAGSQYVKMEKQYA